MATARLQQEMEELRKEVKELHSVLSTLLSQKSDSTSMCSHGISSNEFCSTCESNAGYYDAFEPHLRDSGEYSTPRSHLPEHAVAAPQKPHSSARRRPATPPRAYSGVSHSGAPPRAHSGAPPRAHSGAPPRAHSGAPRAHSGAQPRAHSGVSHHSGASHYEDSSQNCRHGINTHVYCIDCES